MTRGENVVAALVAAILTFGIASGCVGSWRDEAPQPADQAHAVSVVHPGQQLVGGEEVLYEEEDEFGRPVSSSGKAGEFVVALTYIGTIVAGIVLPLLVL